MFDSNATIKAHVAAVNGCPDIIGELHALYFCGHLLSDAEARFSLEKARKRTVELLAAIDAIEAASARAPLDEHAQSIRDAA